MCSNQAQTLLEKHTLLETVLKGKKSFSVQKREALTKTDQKYKTQKSDDEEEEEERKKVCFLILS